MRPEEKPIHVRVAEALGWEWATFCGISILMSPGRYEREAFPGSSWSRGCTGKIRDPETTFYDSDRRVQEFPPIPRYDTDWSATGPLIERYGISIECWGSSWSAQGGLDEDGSPLYASGGTPLLAVCHLILALAEAGKLAR